MAESTSPIPIYLEIGQKKIFAVALEWPGYQRWARDEEAALAAFVAAGPRYAAIVRPAGLDFSAPSGSAGLRIIERVPGDVTTDFGAPGAVLERDTAPLDSAEAERLAAVLDACWAALEQVSAAAAGKELRMGPRGGGRELDAILEHVIGAEESYLRKLGVHVKFDGEVTAAAQMVALRQRMRDGLAAAAAGELPTAGPRGGVLWPARYYARRSGYHLVDHIWEIEERIIP